MHEVTASTPLPLRRVLAACAVAALQAWPGAGAVAQSVYKSTMKDGKVIYGEKPAPGALKVEQMGVNTRPMSSGDTPGAQPASAAAQQMLQEGRDREQARQQAQAEVRAAQDDLSAAQQAAQSGVEPREGERIGTVSGGGRFTDDYRLRQRQLADNVQRAQSRYDAALEKLNGLR